MTLGGGNVAWSLRSGVPYCVSGHRLHRRRAGSEGGLFCRVCFLVGMTSHEVRVGAMRRNTEDLGVFLAMAMLTTSVHDCDDANAWDFELHDVDHDPQGFTDSPASSEIEHGQGHWPLRTEADQRGIEGVLRDRRRREKTNLGTYDTSSHHHSQPALEVVRRRLAERNGGDDLPDEGEYGIAADGYVGHTAQRITTGVHAYHPETGRPSHGYLRGRNELLDTEISRNGEDMLMHVAVPQDGDAVECDFPIFFHKGDAARATGYTPIAISIAGYYRVSVTRFEWVLAGIASDNPEHGNDPKLWLNHVMLQGWRAP